MPGKISLLKAAFRYKCPACGTGDIYAKLLEIKSRCGSCGHRLKENDVGDGAVFFAMLIAGAVVAGLAFLAEIYFMLPLILHLIIWFPVTIALSIFLLKLVKSILLTLQYRHNVDGFKDKK